jgi:hypothetical protein
MHRRFESLIAPPGRPVVEPLGGQAQDPEDGQKSSGPATGGGRDEENLGFDEGWQAHSDQQQADEKGVGVKNGGIEFGHAGGLFTPPQPLGDGDVKQGEGD